MDQLQLLWNYQQADIAVDRTESNIKRSPTRQKLVKLRDYLVEQQNTIKHIEEEVGNMADRLEVLKDAVARTEDQLKTLQAKIESEPATDSAAAASYIADVQKLLNKINDYEQEIKRIRKDAGDRERLQHDVKVRAAKAKNEFDTLKATYDEEYQGKANELQQMKKELEEKAKEIAPEYMEKYITIKRHSVPPLARLLGDQCGGCNMSLPSSVVRNIKAGKEVECENCGRLLLPD